MTGVDIFQRNSGLWVDLASSVTPPPPNPQLFPGDPGPGKIMWGATRQGGVSSEPARALQFATAAGRSGHLYPKTFRQYIQPFGSISAGVTAANAAVADAATVNSWGAIPFIDCKELSGTSFLQVSTGAIDQFIDALMQGLVGLGKPAIVGYHQEPTGDGLGGASDYAAAVGRFAQRRTLAGGDPFISITGCLGYGSFNAAGGGLDSAALASWYQPLAAVCDVWGSHHYIQVQPTASDATWTSKATMNQLVGWGWDVQDSIDNTKARVHGEWGVHTKANDLAFSPNFMDQFLAYGISRKLRAACFFDSSVNSPNGSWALDTPIIPANTPDSTRLVRFAQELIDPRVVGPAPLP